MVTTKSNYEEDLETILNDLNLNCNNSCTINQVHSNKIFHAKKGKFYGNGDGLIADSFNNLILDTPSKIGKPRQ